MMDLSVLIPARNEMFLQRTVEDVLEHTRADTEVIVVLDGAWPDPGMPAHKRVTVIHCPESIGQRAAVNEAARVSRAPYIMKLDAHCSVGEGFDRELLAGAGELGRDVLQVPAQYNLHAFDWVCPEGHRRYQGPSGVCEECGAATTRDMVWRRRESRLSTAWRFDDVLHFQYWGQFKHTEEGQKELSETMSLLGACWFCDRERYWELDGLDEAHGGWGQMGTELACKWWLSGGRVVCNKRTWFAHMFRTQGGDFGFPYKLRGRDVDKAREYSRDLWLNDKWPKAKRPFKWLIDKFNPPGWESDVSRVLPDRQGAGDAPGSAEVEASVVVGPTKGVVYYSDNRLDPGILLPVQQQLDRATNGHQVVSVTLGSADFGEIRVAYMNLERGVLTMFRQILAGLEMSDADVVFLCEHDVLYHPSHFDFTPPRKDVYYYNENVWKVDAETGQALFYYTKQTSGLCAYRELLLQHYRTRVERVAREGFTRRMGFEPGTHRRKERVDDHKAERWMSKHPNIDIRHVHNLTPSRWKQEQFRDKRNCRGWTEADEVPGWGKTKGRFKTFLGEVAG